MSSNPHEENENENEEEGEGDDVDETAAEDDLELAEPEYETEEDIKFTTPHPEDLDSIEQQSHLLEQDEPFEYLDEEPIVEAPYYGYGYAPHQHPLWKALLWLVAIGLVVWLIYVWWKSRQSAVPVLAPMQEPLPKFQAQPPMMAPQPRKTTLRESLQQVLGTDQSQMAPQSIAMSVQPKMPGHVWEGMGDSNCVSVNDGLNNVQSGTLNLERGKPYKFIYNNAQQPIYFTTSPIGNSNGSDRIAGSPEPFKNDCIVVFGSHYPEKFYYQVAKGKYMGGLVNLSRS